MRDPPAATLPAAPCLNTREENAVTDIAQIWKYDLRQGNSNSPHEGACLMDAVSWYEYGALGDHPDCVCPVIGAFARGANDAMSDSGRQRLKIFIPRLVGTVDPAYEQARAEYLAWQAIRVFAPIMLDVAGLRLQANQLRLFKGTLPAAGSAAFAGGFPFAADAATSAASAAVRAGFSDDDAADDAVTAAASAAFAAVRAADPAATSGVVRDAAVTAAVAAARAADVAATYAAPAPIEHALVAAMDGLLRIGRQAEPIAPQRMAEAVRLFDAARAIASREAELQTGGMEI